MSRYLQTLNIFNLNKANLDLTFSYKCKFSSFDKNKIKISYSLRIPEPYAFSHSFVTNSTECSKKLHWIFGEGIFGKRDLQVPLGFVCFLTDLSKI